MYVIIFKQHGALGVQQEVYGPFDSYADAEEALANGKVPFLFGQGGREWPDEQRPTDGYRYIEELNWVEGCVL